MRLGTTTGVAGQRDGERRAAPGRTVRLEVREHPFSGAWTPSRRAGPTPRAASPSPRAQAQPPGPGRARRRAARAGHREPDRAGVRAARVHALLQAARHARDPAAPGLHRAQAGAAQRADALLRRPVQAGQARSLHGAARAVPHADGDPRVRAGRYIAARDGAHPGLLRGPLHLRELLPLLGGLGHGQPRPALPARARSGSRTRARRPRAAPGPSRPASRRGRP